MRRFVLGASLLCLPAAAHAWGPLGHHLTARLAADYLSKDARREVHRLLGTSSLTDASTWADSIRTLRPETGPWHYMNVPVDSICGSWARYCPREGCILAAIDRYSAITGWDASGRPPGE